MVDEPPDMETTALKKHLAESENYKQIHVFAVFWLNTDSSWCASWVHQEETLITAEHYSNLCDSK